MADRGQFCRQTMLVYPEGCSERTDSSNKTVEIDKYKLGRRIYHRAILLRSSGCFAVLSAILVNHYSFPLRTETMTL